MSLLCIVVASASALYDPTFHTGGLSGQMVAASSSSADESVELTVQTRLTQEHQQLATEKYNMLTVIQEISAILSAGTASQDEVNAHFTTQGCSTSECTELGQGAHGSAYKCGDTIIKTPIGKSGNFVAELANEADVMQRMNKAEVPCMPTFISYEDGASGCLVMNVVVEDGKPPWGTSSSGWRFEKNGGNKITDAEITAKIQDMLDKAEASNVEGHDKHPNNFLVPNVQNVDELKKEACPIFMIDMPEYTYDDQDNIKNNKSPWKGIKSNCAGLQKNFVPNLRC